VPRISNRCGGAKGRQSRIKKDYRGKKQLDHSSAREAARGMAPVFAEADGMKRSSGRRIGLFAKQTSCRIRAKPQGKVGN